MLKKNKKIKMKKRKKEDNKEGKQNLDDNEKKFIEHKQEGLKILQDGILSMIFANEGINSEGFKRLKDKLNDIKKNHSDINNLFKQYAQEDQEEVDKELDLLEEEFNQI